MKVFFDSEFTGLKKDSDLISIGLVSENGEGLYIEFNDYRTELVDEWIMENVISNLLHKNLNQLDDICENAIYLKGDRKTATSLILNWFNTISSKDEQIEIWSDCLSYDWVLFNDLFGGALSIPEKIYYIPFDICTLFKLKGIDPDINRENFVGIKNTENKHNALHDAMVIKMCYDKLMNTNINKGEVNND